MLAHDPFVAYIEQHTGLRDGRFSRSFELSLRRHMFVYAAFHESLARYATTVPHFHDDGAIPLCTFCEPRADGCHSCLCSLPPESYAMPLWAPAASMPTVMQRVHLTHSSLPSLSKMCTSTYKHVCELALLPNTLLGPRNDSRNGAPFATDNEEQLGKTLAGLPSLVSLALGEVRDVSDVVKHCPRLRSVFVLSTATLLRSMPNLTRFSCVRHFAGDVINCVAHPKCVEATVSLGNALGGCTALTALRLHGHHCSYVHINTVLYDTARALPQLRFLALDVENELRAGAGPDLSQLLELHASILSNNWGSISTDTAGKVWVEFRGSDWMRVRAMAHCVPKRATLRPPSVDSATSTVIMRWVLATAPMWLFRRTTALLLTPLLHDRTIWRFDIDTLLRPS